MGSSVIVTGEPSKPKISKIMVALLAISIAVALLWPSTEQQLAASEAQEKEKFKMKLMNQLKGAMGNSKKCEQIEDKEERAACFEKLMDDMKKKMEILRSRKEAAGQSDKTLQDAFQKADELSKHIDPSKINFGKSKSEL
ncbi:unnamed protein product, partial [Mesorhabditis spiculigera]